MLETLVRQSGKGSPRACVICLHGLGADGHDFEPLVQALRLPADRPVRFIFPHAPVRAVTINMGLAMRAWYDIRGLDLQSGEDGTGIRESAAEVEQLVQAQQEAGIDAGSIVLAGFSQGGAVATHLALRYPHPLAGLLAMSTYLPLASSLSAEASPENRQLPILQQHGRDDPMIPLTLARSSCEQLRQQGYTVDWQEYPMQHELCAAQIDAIRHWLGARLRLEGQAAHD